MRCQTSPLYFFGSFVLVMCLSLLLSTGCSGEINAQAGTVSLDGATHKSGFGFGKDSMSSPQAPAVADAAQADNASTRAPKTNPSPSSSALDVMSFNPQTGKKDEVFLVDTNNDGMMEAVFLASNAWLEPSLTNQDAFVYAYGPCFDGKLEEQDRVFASNGYYVVDFSKFAFPCKAMFTLVSSIGTDGKPPTKTMSNWYWWQNARFCAQGSTLCDLQPNGQPWEEWLFGVWWHPQMGLVPNGNGYTHNRQLP